MASMRMLLNSAGNDDTGERLDVRTVHRPVDADLVLQQIDHELNRSARKDAFATWRLSAGHKPHALDELVERCLRCLGQVKHNQCW